MKMEPVIFTDISAYSIVDALGLVVLNEPLRMEILCD